MELLIVAGVLFLLGVGIFGGAAIQDFLTRARQEGWHLYKSSSWKPEKAYLVEPTRCRCTELKCCQIKESDTEVPDDKLQRIIKDELGRALAEPPNMPDPENVFFDDCGYPDTSKGRPKK